MFAWGRKLVPQRSKQTIVRHDCLAIITLGSWRCWLFWRAKPLILIFRNRKPQKPITATATPRNLIQWKRKKKTCSQWQARKSNLFSSTTYTRQSFCPRWLQRRFHQLYWSIFWQHEAQTWCHAYHSLKNVTCPSSRHFALLPLI